MRVVGAVLVLGLLAGCARQPTATARRQESPSSREGHVHFLIPGAPGGGWDQTARGVGNALVQSGLSERVSFENLSGGGGGRALAHLIATAPRQQGTWMVTSTPIVLRSLRGRLPQSFRDLTPIAAIIGDHMAFAVRSDSTFESWGDVESSFAKDPRSVKMGGGSVRGGLDHLFSALALRASGQDPAELRYVAYDTGGKAMVALLSGEVPVIATGVGEAMEAWRDGQVRILAVAAENRLSDAPQIPTLRESGVEVDFVNWRGFFGAPGLDASSIEASVNLLTELLQTAEWAETRRRHGWSEIFRPGPAFESFLDDQERELRALLETLGMSTRGAEAG